MTRYRLTIEYDGAPFMGWQRQAHGASVQGAIEAAVLAAFGEDVTLAAAGRTDAGVHALAMTAHLDLERDITPFRLAGALNAHLRPQPVSVLDAAIAPEGWHARFSCVGRRYEYRMVERRAPLALDAGRAWRLAGPLDHVAMRQAAAMLVGRHDFTTFRSAHCQADNPVRTLDRLDVARMRERITVHAAARSFLHHQVRSMVGCLALVGLGRWPVERMGEALAARDRAALGLNAPADGLFFVEAVYADDPDKPSERVVADNLRA